ncbi:MAG: hypothetical protein ACYCUI_09660 [Vulcanimicrobiaceae bacterium]|jgi:hypothetical protein
MVRDAQDEIRRAGEAQFLLNHPLLREFLSHIRTTLASERAKASIRDTELHTRLVMWEQTANAFERAMLQTIETGEMAKVQIAKPSFAGFRR